MEVTNPYAAPKAEVADLPEQRYYTPEQVLLATMVGTPLAGGYFFSRNYALFGFPKKAEIALLWPVVILIGSIGLGYVLPEHSSRMLPAAIIAGMYRWYAKEKFQGMIAERRQLGVGSVLLVASPWPVTGISGADWRALRGGGRFDSEAIGRAIAGVRLPAEMRKGRPVLTDPKRCVSGSEVAGVLGATRGCAGLSWIHARAGDPD
jgi:hypothetical protein